MRHELVWRDGVPRVLTVPLVCSPAQMRLALFRLGLLDEVEAIVATDQEAVIVWEYATQIDRASPFIQRLATNGIRSFTAGEIDQIFALAMTL